MEVTKQENSEDADKEQVERRILRSRIIEGNSSTPILDSKSVDPCIDLVQNNVATTNSSSLKLPSINHSTPIKMSLRNGTKSISSNVSEKGDSEIDDNEKGLKIIPTSENHKEGSAADDTESLKSLSPRSQCGSEASNISVRVLRNSKVILLEKMGNVDLKPCKIVLDAIKEEKVSENVDNEVDVDNSKAILDENSGEKNNDVISDSRPVAEKTNINDQNDKTNVNDQNDGSGNDEPCENQEGSKIIEENDQNDCDDKEKEISKSIDDILDECPNLEIVNENTSSSLSENSVDPGTKSTEITVQNITKSDESILQEKDKLVGNEGDDDNDDNDDDDDDDDGNNDNASNTTEEVLSVKTVSYRKPINDTSIDNELSKEFEESGNSEKHERCVINSTSNENELLATEIKDIENNSPTQSAGVDKNAIHGEIAEVMISDNSSAVSDENNLKKPVEENDGSLQLVSIVFGEVNKDIDSVHKKSNKKIEELKVHPVKESCINQAEVGVEERGWELINDGNKNTETADNFDKKVSSKLPDKISSKQQEEETHVNFGNVLNLLGIEKSNEVNVIDDSGDSSSESSEVIISLEGKDRTHITKHVEIEKSPAQYYGIGKDVLRTIVKEAVAEAVGDLKQEIYSNVKKEFNIVTQVLIDEIRKGKKRKLDESGILDDDDSLSEVSYINQSTVRANSQKVLPVKSLSKIKKSKDDLVKELLQDVSGNLRVSLSKKNIKKLKLDKTKDKKKIKRIDEDEDKSQNLILVETTDDDDEDYNFNSIQSEVKESVGKASKKSKKKKLKLLKENIVTDKVVKNKHNLKLTETLGSSSLQHSDPSEPSRSGVLKDKKKRKRKLSLAVDECSDTDGKAFESNHELVDCEIYSENHSNIERKKKKKKKQNNLQGDLSIVNVEPSLIERQSDHLLDKKKSKKNLKDNPGFSLEVDNIAFDYHKKNVNKISKFSNVENKTDKKKIKKKTKQNLSNKNLELSSVNDSLNADDDIVISSNVQKKRKRKNVKQLSCDTLGSISSIQPHSQVLKKKKKLKHYQPASTSNSNSQEFLQGMESLIGSEIGFGSDSNNEVSLLKKMKKWKSNNKSKSYRVTPYMDKHN